VVLSATQAAIDLGGLAASAAVPSDTPVQLNIFVGGKQVALPANIGVNADDSTASVFTTDTSGAISIASGATATLGDFFTIWRTSAGQAGNNPSATFDGTELLGNTADTTNTVQMFVNGTLSSEFDQYTLQPDDHIVLVYGSNPVVSLNTNFGPLVFELFEQQTPGTVDNFLTYVNDGDYINSFFHRSASNFVIQGGGFSTTSTTFTDTSQFSPIPTNPPIANEPGISNVRGTVAMAKVGGDPNSATNQFFVNLQDNSGNLDAQNGGFTVFAQVLDMSIADRIAALPIVTGNPAPFGSLPLSNNQQLVVIDSTVGAGRLTGVKYVDANENGTRDAGERGIGGASVFIDANDNGQLDAGELSTVTDTDGRFLFEVQPGDYTLRSVVATGETATQPVSPDSYSVTAEIGRTVPDLNFGETRTPGQGGSTVSGFVYLDANNDGVRDASEVGVPGSQITLSGTTDGGDSVTRSVITLDDGSYGFDAVASGVYQLAQTQPQALLDGIDSTAVSGAVAGDDQITNVVVNGDQEFAENNFGERGLKAQYVSPAWFFASASSTGTVFREMVARGESLAGNDTLATAIRSGGSVTPPDVTPPKDVNTPPVAVADAYTAQAGGTLDVPTATGVLANDTDAEGDSLTAAVVDIPTNGTLTLNADGSFTYVPNAQFTGTDSFTYTANDGTDASNTATVTLQVVGNSFSVNENSAAGTVVGTLSADGLTPPAIYEIDNPNAPKELALVPDDHLSGDPSASLLLIEYVDFQCPICATFHPIVKNLETQFNSDLLVVRRHFPLTSIHPNALAAARAAEAAGRQGKFDEMGDLLFQNQNQWSSATDPSTFFQQFATTLGLDLAQFASDVADPDVDARVQRDLQAANDLGLAGTPTFFLNGDKLAINGMPNELSTTLTTALNDADDPFSVNRTTGEIRVTGHTNLNFESTPRIDLSINVADSGGRRDQRAVAINILNVPEAPVAISDAYAVDQEGRLNVAAATGVIANDTDPDGDPITVSLLASPSNGTLNLQGDGSFDYTPDTGFAGTDSFTYQASDGTLTSPETTVTITVRDVNVAPKAVADSYNLEEGQTLSIDAANGVLANDSDVDGDTLTADRVAQPSHGTLNFNADGSFDYTPEAGFFGQDSFTYRANDGALFSSVVTVNLTVAKVNKAPVAVSDQYDVGAGVPLSVGVADGLLSNDSDVDGGSLPALQVGRFGDPAHGSVVVQLDGSFVYTPDDNFVGTDTFTYRASDGQKESPDTTVTLNVAADQVLTIAAGSANGTPVGQVAVAGTPTAPVLYDIVDPAQPAALRLTADDHLTGNPAASAVLIEYVDFQCQACQSLQSLVTDLEQAFGGDLLVVTRHFPVIGLHPNALQAAQAAEAAGSQGQFDAMVDKLFLITNWNQWTVAADPWPFFATYAAELGLNPDQFSTDFSDPSTLARINRDVDTANSIGVSGAPTFFVNDQQVGFPWTFSVFSDRIQGELDAANKPFSMDRRTGEITVANSAVLDPAVNPVITLPVRVSDANGLFDTVVVQVNVVDGSTAAVAADGVDGVDGVDAMHAMDAVFAEVQDWRMP